MYVYMYIYIWICVYMFVCIYVCMYIYVYIAIFYTFVYLCLIVYNWFKNGHFNISLLYFELGKHVCIFLPSFILWQIDTYLLPKIMKIEKHWELNWVESFLSQQQNLLHISLSIRCRFRTRSNKNIQDKAQGPKAEVYLALICLGLSGYIDNDGSLNILM